MNRGWNAYHWVREIEAFGPKSGAAAPATALAIEDKSWTGDLLAATLSRVGAARAANVYAVAGAAHHETDFSAWTNDLPAVLVGSFAAGQAELPFVFANVP